MSRPNRLVTLLAVLIVSTASAQDEFRDSQGHVCGVTGTARSDANKALNTKKNRTTVPQDQDIDGSISLANMLAPGDDVDRFDEQKGAKVVGFVVDVKPGGKETCNCEASLPVDKDTHVELALSENAPPEIQRVIVEVTPRVRALMRQQGQDWATETLQQTIKGKWVEITGWLLFDDMHVSQAENTNPGNPTNFRATCWEIHPITSVRILDGSPEDVHIIHPDLLKAFHKVHADALSRNETKRAAMKARNEKILAKYDKDELKEDQTHPD